MNFLLPPSSLFIFKTACAVVPEPAKESRTMESLSVAILKILSMSRLGFAVSNGTLPSKSALISAVASVDVPTSSANHIDAATLPCIFCKCFFIRIPPLPPLVKYSSGHFPSENLLSAFRFEVSRSSTRTIAGISGKPSASVASQTAIRRSLSSNIFNS